jgi:hypothetical protein
VTNDGKREVGILLVHGIGRQRPGETLQRFGAPLPVWLQTWCQAAAPGATVRFQREADGIEMELERLVGLAGALGAVLLEVVLRLLGLVASPPLPSWQR